MEPSPAPDAPVRVDGLLRRARARIDAAEAELLLAHALGQSRTWLFMHGDAEPDAAAVEAFVALVDRREAGEPVAYLVGHRGFWRFDLQVTPATLIPRAETELLVELALARLPKDRPLWIADLGTGSGAIALALAYERPDAIVIATDFSAEALAVARANAQALRLGNVEFRQGDWYAPLGDESFDLIASNPPYIEVDDIHLGQGDLRFEPVTALASGADGLEAIRLIACGAAGHLRPGGWLLIEHGWDQGGAVRALLSASGLMDVETAKDLEQRDRVTLARGPG